MNDIDLIIQKKRNPTRIINKIKSYSPSINTKVLKLRSLHSPNTSKSKNKLSKNNTTKKLINIFGCNLSSLKNGFKSKINSKKNNKQVGEFKKTIKSTSIMLNGKCISLFTLKAKQALLHNIKLNIPLKAERVIAPIQRIGNCWFNVFFTNFFISDKGRKFFKSFRIMMIRGKTFDGTNISTNLKKAFLLFNVAIEAAYNYFPESANIATKLNTNNILFSIYESIPKKYRIRDIPTIDQAGNPIKYYMSLTNYLNSNDIYIHKISHNEHYEMDKQFKECMQNLKDLNKVPHMIILNTFGKLHVSKTIQFKKNGVTYKYKLDSVAIIDIDGNHFCSVLHINNKEYGFDGLSASRLNKFKWTHLLNKNTDWTFTGTNEGYSPSDKLVWNFTNGFQELCYYRVN